MVTFARTRPLFFFFTLTFFFSWLIWVPMALDYYSLLPFRLDPGFVLVVRLFGTFGPAAAASVVVSLAGKKPALRHLWGQLKLWRVHWTWYLLSILALPLLIFGISWFYASLPASDPLPFQPVTAGNLLLIMVILTLSVLGEEVGWRGFALTQLQKLYTPLRASLTLGTIHTVWHLPFWIILGEQDRFGWWYFGLNWLWILAITILLTWLINHTGGSLLIAFLFHWSLNFVTVGFLPITTVVGAYLLLIGAGWILALGVIPTLKEPVSIKSMLSQVSNRTRT